MNYVSSKPGIIGVFESGSLPSRAGEMKPEEVIITLLISRVGRPSSSFKTRDFFRGWANSDASGFLKITLLLLAMLVEFAVVFVMSVITVDGSVVVVIGFATEVVSSVDISVSSDWSAGKSGNYKKASWKIQRKIYPPSLEKSEASARVCVPVG